jgi:hypothetical protein
MTTFAIEKQPSKPSFIATLIPKAEFAFCIMGLIFFSGAHNALTDYFLGESIGGLIGSLMRYLVILISFSLLVWRWPLTISVARRGLWIWVLFILQALSYFWSELPEWSYLSIRGELLPMALFGLYFGSRYSLKEQLKILIFFLSGSALASFLVVFLLPEIGRHPATEFEGAWRGIYGHKNGLSAFMSLTVLGFLSILLGRDKNKFISARFCFDRPGNHYDTHRFIHVLNRYYSGHRFIGNFVFISPLSMAWKTFCACVRRVCRVDNWYCFTRCN